MTEKKQNNTEKAIAGLNKTFGDNSVMRIDAKPLKSSVTNTGIRSLNRILGIGGYPKGRLVEIYGKESAGKCLTEDSYILTANDGYQTIRDIFESNGLQLFNVFKQIEKVYPIINRYGEPENTTHFTFNAKKKIIRIRTRSGFEHNVTFNHPLQCIDENGWLIWKNASNITDKDYLVGVNTSCFGNTSVDENEAYMLGLIIADGSMQKNRIIITSDDIDIKSFIDVHVRNLLDIEPKKYDNNDKDSVNYHFSNQKKINSFYSKFSLSPSLSKNKKLPSKIMSFNKTSIARFICGYFDSEAYFTTNSIEVSSASKDLLYQIKLILSQFNISSTLYPKHIKQYPENEYWILLITGMDYFSFCNNIGLIYSKSTKVINIMQKAKPTKSCSRNIPNISNLLKSYYNSGDNRSVEISLKLGDFKSKHIDCSTPNLIDFLNKCNGNNLLRGYLVSLLDKTFDRVKDVEILEAVPTFDFAMSDTHSFIADGSINHNTTVCIHGMIEAQKDGSEVAMVDMENAFDVEYAKSLGLKADGFYIAQPSYGEEALEITKQLISIGSVKFIVIDSVASLIPKSELEKEVGSNNLGLQARLMGQACRTLAPLCNAHKATVIFTNQIREKIGVVYGSPEVTSGGNALKFFASIRLDIRRTETIKKDKEDIGIRAKIKVVKNKMAPPSKVTHVNIMYGEGVDVISDVLNEAVTSGIITKGGSWFSYGDTKLGQGSEKVIELIKNDEALLNEIIAKVDGNDLFNQKS